MSFRLPPPNQILPGTQLTSERHERLHRTPWNRLPASVYHRHPFQETINQGERYEARLFARHSHLRNLVLLNLLSKPFNYHAN